MPEIVGNNQIQTKISFQMGVYELTRSDAFTQVLDYSLDSIKVGWSICSISLALKVKNATFSTC